MKKKALKTIELIFVNLITLSRLFGAIILPIIYHFKDSSTFALWTISFFLSDCIDGFLARKFKVSTFFGAGIDALGDKLLNASAFILLSLKYNSMLLPLIIEITIMYTIYSTYRYGGNVQSSRTGKIKTVILDIFVILSFCFISLPKFNINAQFIYYLINKTESYINVFSVIITISCLIALLDYIKKNKLARSNPKSNDIKYEQKKRKPWKKVFQDAFNTEYYFKHRNESIMKQFYK